MNSREFRREFPVERFPPILNKRGAVSMSAVAMRFSAAGCPWAKPEVAAAMIKAGYSPQTALSLAILAHYVSDLMVDPAERVCGAILAQLRVNHAIAAPNGKCAEDLAAQREGRPSRWGTPEFHRKAQS